MRELSNYDLTAVEIAEWAAKRAFIPDDIWPTVRKWSVSPTADFVVTRITHGGRLFMLVKRAEPPWEGQWFVPGGRIKPLEHPDDACRRNVQRELGFPPSEVWFIGFVPVRNPDSPEGVDWPSLWHLYEVPVKTGVKLNLNRENLEVHWFRWIDPGFPEPVRRALEMAGFHYKELAMDTS